jgi:hypothetical protein
VCLQALRVCVELRVRVSRGRSRTMLPPSRLALLCRSLALAPHSRRAAHFDGKSARDIGSGVGQQPASSRAVDAGAAPRGASIVEVVHRRVVHEQAAPRRTDCESSTSATCANLAGKVAGCAGLL